MEKCKYNTVREFIESSEIYNNIIDDKLVDSGSFDCGIINNSIFLENSMIDVSISDIIGYEKCWMENGDGLISNFSSFFDLHNGDPYHTRGNKMLEIPFDNIIEKLTPSFTSEPINTVEINNKYFIIGNGMHRFTALKLAYLLELHNGKEKEELDKKYTIKVKNRSIDKLKTGCQMILKEIDPSIYIFSETVYDPYYRLTNNAEVIIDNEKIIMSDEMLLKYTLERINTIKQGTRYELFLGILNGTFHYRIMTKESTGYKILETYFPELLNDIIDKYEIGENNNETRISI